LEYEPDLKEQEESLKVSLLNQYPDLKLRQPFSPQEREQEKQLVSDSIPFKFDRNDKVTKSLTIVRNQH